MSATEIATVISSSSLAELVWLDADGSPQVRGTVSLLRDDVPVLAFTYADESVAREVAASALVALSLTETRSTGAGFTPLLLCGRPRLVEDPQGEMFTDGLLRQELLRFPPARLYADSPLLRREHWWYLPRLLVEIEVDSAQPMTARSHADDQLLVTSADGSVDARVAQIAESSPELLTLTFAGAPPPPGDAVLFGQDASFPDLEMWSQWKHRGHWDGQQLTVHDAPPRTGLAPAPGLLQRLRRQRDLEKRCRRAIP